MFNTQIKKYSSVLKILITHKLNRFTLKSFALKSNVMFVFPILILLPGR